MNLTLRQLLCASVLTLAAARAFTADTGPAPTAKPAATADPLAGARSLIAARRWSAAIAELARVDDRGSADWNNLMGYCQRKTTPPDYAAAAASYDEALRIDPRHRGALEYSGELYLMTGRLPEAEARLATLGEACNSRCEEYGDLKTAVQKYKANGNKYVAAH